MPRHAIVDCSRRLVCALLAGLLLFAGLSAHASAEQTAPWQIAATVHDALFAARAALLTDDTAAAQAAVADARAAYDTGLAAELAASTPNAHTLIQQGLDEAAAAVTADDTARLSHAGGLVWGGLLLAGYQRTLAATEANQPTEAQNWRLLRAYRTSTRVSAPSADATLALDNLADGLTTPEEAAATVRADFLDTFQSLLNEVLATLRRDDGTAAPTRQAEAAGLASGYWAILADGYAAQRGEIARHDADAAFARLSAAVLAGNAAGTSAALTDIDALLHGYRAVLLSAEEQVKRAGQLSRFIGLVPVEYGRGVDQGRVILDIEIQEAITFLAAARSAFDDLLPTFEARDAAASAEAAALFDGLATNLRAAGERSAIAAPEQIEADSSRLTTILSNLYPPEWSDAATHDPFVAIDDLLDQVESAVAAGQYSKAESLRLEAYATFDLGPELRLKAFDPGLIARVDGLFWHGYDGQTGLADLLGNRAAPAEVAASRAALDEALADTERTLGEAGGSSLSVVINSSIIVFREGLEAVLIFATLLASLVGANRGYRRPMVIGAAVAGVATVITWWLLYAVLASFRGYGEKLEAVVSLVAIAVLLLILNWFFHNVYWTRWIQRMHGQRRRILGASVGQATGFILLGFSSVYREGFETSLFLQALVLDAGIATVLEGVALGLAATAAVGVLIFALQAKLPFKRMLILTGALIAIVLVTMVGQTIHILQAVGWLPVTPVEGFSPPYWAGVWLGIFPTWEGLLAQFAAAAFVIGSYFVAERLKEREQRGGGLQPAL